MAQWAGQSNIYLLDVTVISVKLGQALWLNADAIGALEFAAVSLEAVAVFLATIVAELAAASGRGATLVEALPFDCKAA